MPCCKCNKSGRCTNCTCVKSSKKCNSCLPKRLGNCRNDNQDQTEQETVEFEPQSPQQSPVQVPLQAINEEVSQSIAPDSLPPFEPAQPTNFTWGNRSAEEISTTLNEIYEETVHWRKNLFKVPSGKQGKSFVAELARLFQSYADQSAMEAVVSFPAHHFR